MFKWMMGGGSNDDHRCVKRFAQICQLPPIAGFSAEINRPHCTPATSHLARGIAPAVLVVHAAAAANELAVPIRVSLEQWLPLFSSVGPDGQGARRFLDWRASTLLLPWEMVDCLIH